VGDGLVTQIPALLISTATGLIVTRAASEAHLGRDIAKQLSANPRALFMTAGFLCALAVIPGLPKLPLLTIAALLGGTAYFIRRGAKEDAVASAQQPPSPTPGHRGQTVWNDYSWCLGQERGCRTWREEQVRGRKSEVAAF